MCFRIAAAVGALLLAACASMPLGHPGSASVQLPPGGFTTLGNDRVRLLPDSEAAFTEIRQQILSASRSVQVEMYEFGRRDLINALVADHDRGVSVTLITDPTERSSNATAPLLRDAGVDVIEYPVRKEAIDHVKLLLIDDNVAIIGGINWGAGSYRNHDFDIEAQGPLVTNLEAIYARDLVAAGRNVAVPAPVYDPDAIAGTTLPDASIRSLVATVIASAQHSLDIAMYTFTDKSTVAAVIDAHNHGVAVRVLLDSSQRVNDPATAALQQAGVDIRLFAPENGLLHAKCAVADSSMVVLGSANWSLGGFERNHEIDVELPHAPAIATDVVSQFDLDWNATG